MSALPATAPLPDPRRYGAPHPDSTLAALVEGNARGDSEARLHLLRWLDQRLAEQRDADIFELLRHAPSPYAYRQLWEAVCAAAERSTPVPRQSAIVVRAFALPVVIIAASREARSISGVLPGIEEVRALLERHGALGAARNFGLGNALCNAAGLEQVKPSDVYCWGEDWTHNKARELGPAAIDVRPGREEVHLRFLAGASITPRDAPSFIETASNIGTWGLPLARVLAGQLAQPGLSVLCMPRAPAGLLKAAHHGRCAELEAAYDLFVSNTVRSFRAMIGDPTVIVSAHQLKGGGAEVRVSMSAVLDDTLLEGFRWPLHPADDFDRIVRTVAELLDDCRVGDVYAIDIILPERMASGTLFLRAQDAAALAASRH